MVLFEFGSRNFVKPDLFVGERVGCYSSRICEEVGVRGGLEHKEIKGGEDCVDEFVVGDML